MITWKMTTLPPLSPVASNSPSWLNSTQDIMSAETHNWWSPCPPCLPPGLPSVTLSSSVPFTCEKHHWISLLPENKYLFHASSSQIHVWKGYARWKYFLSQIPLLYLFPTYPSYYSVSTARLTKIISARDLWTNLDRPETICWLIFSN